MSALFTRFGYLFIVVCIAILFRFYNFPSNPPALNWDEVAIGYNAYSILQTGKDEFGYSYPSTFRSFDDYKMPVYVYMTSASIVLFGYTDFAVRFPAAFFGVLAVVVVYLLTYELTQKKPIALIAALLLAILPWHVQFSRYASEAQVALFFTMSGLLFCMYALRKNGWWLYVSTGMFSLALYTYLSFRALIPLLVLSIVIVFRKKLMGGNVKKHTILSAALFVLAVIPIVVQTVHAGGNIRFSGVSVLNQDEAMQASYSRVAHEGELGINIPRRIFQRPELYTNALLIARGYLKHFDPDFLFFDRGKLHFTPTIGLLYIWLIPAILCGLYGIVKNGSRELKGIVIPLFIIAPIPASVTFDIPHAIRSILLIVPFTLSAAYGIWFMYQTIDKRIVQHGYIAMLALIVLFTSVNFFRQNQIHLPHERSHEWFYGRREMTEYLDAVSDSYDYVVVSQRIEWPYIFMLYYSHYDPADYLAEGGTVSGSWEEQENAYGPYQFRSYTDADKQESVLVAGIPSEFPESVSPVHTIQYLDGTDALYFVKGSDL